LSATKILWGQILVVSVIVLAAIWGATQWTAWRLGYQPQLGTAWTEIAGMPVYPPPAFFLWWYWFDAYAPRIFVEGAIIASSGGFAAIAIAIGMSVWRAREAKEATTYGSARWASALEVRKAGLLRPDGVVLGCFGRDYLRHDGPEHVLCFAPTRSGKGVGLVISTLLTWPGSAIVHDIKGENWQLTAGWRARFARVLLFDPTNAESSAYNPLLEVRRGDAEVRDVQNVADILVDPEGALERRNHWEKTSHALLVGTILHVLYAEADKTLAGVANFLDPRRPIAATLRAMMTTPHLGDRPHPVVASAARELLNKSENERSGVLSTAMSFLGPRTRGSKPASSHHPCRPLPARAPPAVDPIRELTIGATSRFQRQSRMRLGRSPALSLGRSRRIAASGVSGCCQTTKRSWSRSRRPTRSSLSPMTSLTMMLPVPAQCGSASLGPRGRPRLIRMMASHCKARL
jgi:type IV secretion system protein VirD4